MVSQLKIVKEPERQEEDAALDTSSPHPIFYREGSTTLAVPSLGEPMMLPAFFNRRGAFVRDVSIAVYRAYLAQLLKGSSKSLTFADSLAGIGARGIRVANEVEEIDRVFINDINSRALGFARKSVEANSLGEKCVLTRSEGCSFLVSRLQNQTQRFDFVDLDPFGSPSDFVDCAIRAVKDGGLLSMTGTDSAVLCGIYPKVAQRKYLGLPLRTDYCHEIGMRLLFGLAAQTAMRLEAGIVPIFCHHDMHYFRTYFSIKVGNSYSRENEEKIGFILHCFGCGHRCIVKRDELFSLHKEGEADKEVLSKRRRFGGNLLVCPDCGRGSKEKGGRVALAGPLWIDKIQSVDFLTHCRDVSDLTIFSEESDLPLYYDLNSIKLKSGTSMPKIARVLEKLQSNGFTASRTRLNRNSLRTDAKMGELRDVVLELAR
jgi:tRNA (guanine26-N2/guanine27-N2)-dimethyltransferase